MADVFKIMRESTMNYGAIKKNCYYDFITDDKKDIAVIIPARGRTNFNPIVRRAIDTASAYTGLKISTTIIEHSDSPQHKSLCDGQANYIWIPATGTPFNKCLAHNIGALFNQEAKYYMFHDIDILVPCNFFNALWDNLKDHNALQTFTKRRLLQLSEMITRKIIIGEADPLHLTAPNSEIKECLPGAAGGSMLVEHDLFYNVGGFDPEFFTEYSIEDQFFFDKLSLTGSLGFCDNPPIELLHLFHPPAYNQETKSRDWDVFRSFHALSLEEKKSFISEKSLNLRKFITHEAPC